MCRRPIGVWRTTGRSHCHRGPTGASKSVAHRCWCARLAKGCYKTADDRPTKTGRPRPGGWPNDRRGHVRSPAVRGVGRPPGRGQLAVGSGVDDTGPAAGWRMGRPGDLSRPRNLRAPVPGPRWGLGDTRRRDRDRQPLAAQGLGGLIFRPLLRGAVLCTCCSPSPQLGSLVIRRRVSLGLLALLVACTELGLHGLLVPARGLRSGACGGAPTALVGALGAVAVAISLQLLPLRHASSRGSAPTPRCAIRAWCLDLLEAPESSEGGTNPTTRDDLMTRLTRRLGLGKQASDLLKVNLFFRTKGLRLSRMACAVHATIRTVFT